ncbi:DUF5723 family protein [uncultured Winogradskyella sp.]|uniref:DUF5723 family protein n=1 Tax=uncultured Winogradskyella sp. TaxID=395353 RepID=UPI0026098A18|nr:DUF5723 family protein [uncultured Winogradskyella sp.]
MNRAKSFCVVFYFVLSSAFSQNKQLLFGFTDIPQSILLNPSTTLANNGFIGIPLLSKNHFSFGASGVSAYDIFINDGVDFNTKLRNAVFNLDRNDFFTLNQQTDIFSGGFAFGSGIEKDSYLSFGMYVETDAIAYYPEDYAILALEGNANKTGRVFDLSDLNASGEMISVFHFGIGKKINEQLNIGSRIKLYSSVFNFNSTDNSGSFITREGENNLLEHSFNLDLSLQTSGFSDLNNNANSNSSEAIKALRKRLLFGGNMGLGLDFGFTYNPSAQLTVEGSVLDIGFIRHSKGLQNYALRGSYTYEGFNPLFSEVDGGQTPEAYWNEIADEFEELFNIDATASKYTTWRPIKLNLAARYKFGKRQSEKCNCLADDEGYVNAVGGQLFAINRPRAPQLALTAFYYRRLFKGLRAKVTYTIDSFSYTNVGLGVSAYLGPANFYLLADNIIEYQNIAKARSISIQFGLNLVLGRAQKQ